MYRKFQGVIGKLIGDDCGETLAGINIKDLFQPEEDNEPSIARNLGAAFLISLSGETHPQYRAAREYLVTMSERSPFRDSASFFLKGLSIIHSEISGLDSGPGSAREALDELHSLIEEGPFLSDKEEASDRFHSFFFPEGVSILKKAQEMVDALREKRTVTITRPNPSPVKNPAREILFTSNILLTTPPLIKNVDPVPLIDSLLLKESIRTSLKEMVGEEQLFWYDHPVQIGVERENNEIIYGLRELDKALDHELFRGTMSETDSLNCVLSVSVTHRGLHAVSKEYLEEELKSCADIRRLNLFIFTEDETERLNEEILIPASERYFKGRDASVLREIVGVDGSYGRHYSFLKAVAAFWNVFIDPEIRGTFKIDLDQVFVQEKLIEETGLTAFEHFQTPLWGAKGIDNEGNRVDLGMIAGALVNRNDIEQSLFTPDVTFPQNDIKADEWVFLSRLPQALSTEAEMMTRYTKGNPDGKKQCVQRIHVTGGTNGILINSLRRHRPFTPTFIGRAEDQSYIMSILFRETNEEFLRYVHKDGLIMSHDKEVFTEESIRAARIGKMVGDYARILWFSYYARALPWPLKRIKDILDPFTGCFISRIPLTLVYLRFALKAATFFQNKETEEGLAFVKTGTRILDQVIDYLGKEPNPLIEQYKKEREGWNLYFDILEEIEKGLKEGDPFAGELKEKGTALVNDCRIKC